MTASSGDSIADGDSRVRPESLTAGLQRALEARGVQVSEGEPVTALTPDGGRWLVETSNGSLAASTVVLASGVDTVRLTAPLRTRFPIVAAKGYSRTYRPDPSGPRRAVYLEAPKVAISAFDGGVRVSGTLELGAHGLALSSRRLAAITAAAQRAMPGWRMPSDPQDWAGMRSLSPDGLPLDRSRAGPTRPARRDRARDARDNAGAGHRRARGGSAARRPAGSAAGGIRSGAVWARQMTARG